MKILIGLFVLIIGSAMAERNPKVLSNYEDFLEEAEKITKRKIRATTGGKSKNHRLTDSNIGALDIGKNENKLTKEEYNKVGDLALRHGFRLGDEKNHLHVDKRIDNTARVFLGEKDNFKEAPPSNRFVKELGRNTEAKSKMFDNRVLNNRTPQSVDQVNKTDSGLQKEDNMNGLPRNNEEEEDKIDPLQKASKMAHDSPNVQDGPTSERKKLQTESRNVDNVMGAASTSQQKKANGEQPEVKDQFMEAIGFFLPAIAGGVIGSSLGGAEGASQGIKIGMEGASAFRQAKLARDEFELKKQTQLSGRNRFQQSEFVDEQGRPLTFDPNTNKYLDASGNEAKVFKDPITARQEKSLALRSVQLEHNISKDAQLSDAQVKELKDLTQVEDSIDRIDVLKKDVATGLGKAQFQSLAELADAAPEKFTEMKSETSSALASYVKSISGAQVSEAEAQRLGAIIPNVNDAPKVFEAKLKTFRKIVAANKKAFRQAILKGQPLKAGTIKGLDEAEKEFASQEKQTKEFSRADIDAMKAKIRAERSK